MSIAASTPLRVRYPETDRMGVVYHANHLIWFELGRTELLRELGYDYRTLEEDGIFLPVIEVGARYLSPALYDDRLVVETRLADVGNVKVRFEYDIVRPADDQRVARGFTVHAAVGRDGRPMRIPEELMARLGIAGSAP